MRIGKKLALAALFLSCLWPAQADAGCGCQKPPPPLAAIRPAFASPGGEIVLFAPGIEVGVFYAVTFRSSAQATVLTRGKLRRDLADGIQKPQLVVEVPDLPPGPTSVTVKQGNSVVLEVEDYDFTMLQKPIALPEANRSTIATCYRAAVGADSSVYIPVDVSAITQRMIFTGQADGYRLMFGAEDIAIYNTQGVLMQLLGPEQSGIFAIYDEGGTQSFTLAYDRHEFVTYRAEHSHEDGYGLDPADSEWHTDGTRHIDHDHLVLVFRGLVNPEDLPAPGQTPQFTFHIGTTLPDAADNAPVQPMFVQDNCNSGGTAASRWRSGGGRGADHGKWWGSRRGKRSGGDHEDAAREQESDDQDVSSGEGGSDGSSDEGTDGGTGLEDSGDDGAGEQESVDPGVPSGEGGSDGSSDDGAGDGVVPDDGGDDGAEYPTAILCGAEPRAGCRVPIEPSKAQLLLQDRTPDSRDGLVWKWLKGEKTEPGDFGSPTTTGSVGLCMYDESGDSPGLVLRAITRTGGACSGESGRKSCWRGLGKQDESGDYQDYRYREKGQAPDGIDQMVLQSGDEGRAQLVVIGKGENLALPALPLSLPLRVQLHAETGECWEATYSETGVRKNDPGQFKGVAD